MYCDVLVIEALPEAVRTRYGLSNRMEIIVRTCYKSLYSIITAEMASGVSMPVFLITGVPGIGKSMFSLYFIYRYLQDDRFPDKSFFIEYAQGEYFHFQSDEAHVMRDEVSGEVKEFSFEFSVRKDHEPSAQDLLISDIKGKQEPKQQGRWTLIFASPNSERYKQTMNAPHNYRYTMPTWSELELATANPLKDVWYDRFVSFGGVPRLVLWDGKGQPPQHKFEDALMTKGSAVVDHFFKHGFGNIDPERSYVLMHINPPWLPTANDWLYQEDPVYSFASDEIFKVLAKMHMTSLLTMPINLFNAGIASEVYGGSSGGTLFEKICLWLKPIAGSNIAPSSLLAPATQISILLPCMELLPRDWKANKNKTHIEMLKVGVLYQPKISNLESGDAFCVVPSTNDYWLVVLQITAGERHPVKVNGLNDIISAYPEDIRIKVVRKLLVFITPLDGKLNTVQTLHTQDGKVAQRVPPLVQGFEQFIYRHEV